MQGVKKVAERPSQNAFWAWAPETSQHIAFVWFPPQIQTALRHKSEIEHHRNKIRLRAKRRGHYEFPVVDDLSSGDTRERHRVYRRAQMQIDKILDPTASVPSVFIEPRKRWGPGQAGLPLPSGLRSEGLSVFKGKVSENESKRFIHRKAVQATGVALILRGWPRCRKAAFILRGPLWPRNASLVTVSSKSVF